MDMKMKKKLTRYAMNYIMEQMEETFSNDENMDYEEYVDLTETVFIYDEIVRCSRIDAYLTIYQGGEIEAEFVFNMTM